MLSITSIGVGEENLFIFIDGENAFVRITVILNAKYIIRQLVSETSYKIYKLVTMTKDL